MSTYYKVKFDRYECVYECSVTTTSLQDLIDHRALHDKQAEVVLRVTLKGLHMMTLP